MNPILAGWRRWRLRRECFHHDHVFGVSWINPRLVDSGRRKRFECTGCHQVWIV